MKFHGERENEDIRPLRVVPVRELIRNGASLLNEVEDKGRTIIISRYGRTVAMLSPVPEERRVGRSRRRSELPSGGPGVADDLTPLQQQILMRVADIAPQGYLPIFSPDETAAQHMFSLATMELKGVIDRNAFGRYEMTQRGVRTLKALQAVQEPKPPNRPDSANDTD